MAEPIIRWLEVGHAESLMVEEYGDGYPICSFLAGVHGDEREGVLALLQLSRRLRRRKVYGTIRLIPVANPPAYHAHSRLSPRDGLNLARVFPGALDGSVSERIAAILTERVISDSALIVDLHSAGSEWMMPFLTGYVATSPNLDEPAFGACASFGAHLIWRHDVGSEGRTISTARNLQIPSIYVETGGGNRIVDADVAAYVEGCIGVLSFMGSIDSIDEVSRVSVKVVPGGHGDLDAALTAPIGGHLVAVAQPGQVVNAGDPLFRIFNEANAEATEVPSPSNGIVMAMRRATSIQGGDDLAIVAPEPIELSSTLRSGV